jgi:hypothetical protein
MSKNENSKKLSHKKIQYFFYMCRELFAAFIRIFKLHYVVHVVSYFANLENSFFRFV